VFLRKDKICTNPQGLLVMEMRPEDIESLSLCEAIIAFGHNEVSKTEFVSLSHFLSSCSDHLRRRRVGKLIISFLINIHSC
jgi:hypothetical protein